MTAKKTQSRSSREDPWPERRGPKYANSTSPASALLQSAADTKNLRRLIAKYGSADVRDAALKIGDELLSTRRRGRGRPSKVLDDMHLAAWIYERGEEYRRAGSKKPIEEAELELYNMEFDKSEQKQAGHYVRWQKLTKDQRLRGLKAYRDWYVRLGPKLAKARGLPNWVLERFK
jgi:hypothetical protein